MLLVELINFSKKIKGNTVLSNINIRIESGTVYGLVGPNGAGKTMLLRALAGLLYIPKKNIRYYSSCSKGVIIENPSFIDSYTGLENLQYLASLSKKITDEEIRQVMTELKLDPSDQRRLKEYSLGMKQKLALAQAIMESPDIIILDEPTRGLDKESELIVRKILKEEQQRGAAILIASHNRIDIEELCQKVYSLEKGEIIQCKLINSNI